MNPGWEARGCRAHDGSDGCRASASIRGQWQTGPIPPYRPIYQRHLCIRTSAIHRVCGDLAKSHAQDCMSRAVRPRGFDGRSTVVTLSHRSGRFGCLKTQEPTVSGSTMPKGRGGAFSIVTLTLKGFNASRTSNSSSTGTASVEAISALSSGDNLSSTRWTPAAAGPFTTIASRVRTTPNCGRDFCSSEW